MSSLVHAPAEPLPGLREDPVRLVGELEYDDFAFFALCFHCLHGPLDLHHGKRAFLCRHGPAGPTLPLIGGRASCETRARDHGGKG